MPGIELNWPNKDRVLYEIPQRGSQHKPRYYGDEGTPPWPDHRPLLPVSPHGEPDADPNRLIQGDNLVGLQALLDEGMGGKFQCICIDPPYNTGSAFTHYDDGYEHTIWLGMMRDRVKMLYKLLAENGSLWIFIDDNLAHYLKVLCDEVFGRTNFAANVVWRSADSSNNDAKQFSVDHNALLVYAKNEGWLTQRLARTEEANAHYSNPDNDAKGDWFPGNVSSPHPRKNLQYNITSPTGHVINHPPNGWRWSRELVDEKIDTGEIVFSDDGKRLIRKTYLANQKGLPPSTLWDNIEETGHNRQAKYEQKKLFPGVPTAELFGTPKPERVIKRILELATHPGDWVLDSFAGSGTTAAVAYQMGRKWVTLEQGDHARTHCLPRLDKVRQGTAPYKHAAGGGFVFQQVGPPLVEPDPDFGVPRLNPVYVNGQYQKAVCQLTGFTHQPKEAILHGRAGADGGRYCHVAERGLLVTPEYLVSLRETLAALTPAGGQDAPTCVVYATRAAGGLEGGSGGDSVEVVRIPAGFAKKGGRDA